MAFRTQIDSGAVAHAQPFQGLVPPVADITRLCLKIYIRSDILFCAGKHDLTSLVEYPDLRHPRLCTDGLNNLVQTLSLVLEHAIVGAALHRVAKLAHIHYHSLKGLLFLERYQIKSEGKHRNQEDQTYSQTQFKTQALPKPSKKISTGILFD